MLEAIQKVVRKLREANPDLTYGVATQSPGIKFTQSDKTRHTPTLTLITTVCHL